ncbi:hypothetical protein J5X84_15530 [Streptosporangiaceae bacterium NEAU-GS5]|nr:hypothetical protein [Streptosporangiaceae bacterium NEAU-GS5]
MADAFQLSVIEDPTGDELLDLARWLSDDDVARHIILKRVQRPARPGEMGSVVELLEVLAAPESIGVAVVTAITTWLSTRSRTVKIRIQRGDQVVEIEAASARDIAKTAHHAISILSAQAQAQAQDETAKTTINVANGDFILQHGSGNIGKARHGGAGDIVAGR